MQPFLIFIHIFFLHTESIYKRGQLWKKRIYSPKIKFVPFRLAQVHKLEKHFLIELPPLKMYKLGSNRLEKSISRQNTLVNRLYVLTVGCCCFAHPFGIGGKRRYVILALPNFYNDFLIRNWVCGPATVMQKRTINLLVLVELITQHAVFCVTYIFYRVINFQTVLKSKMKQDDFVKHEHVPGPRSIFL